MNAPQRMDDLTLSAFGIFEPSGNHCMEILLDGMPVTMLFGREQVKQLRKAIEAFEREAIFRDGGPDFQRRITKSLEIGDGR